MDDSTHQPMPTPFHASDAALVALEQLEEGFAHALPLIVLTAAKGMGKSTLVTEALARWGSRVQAVRLSESTEAPDALMPWAIAAFGDTSPLPAGRPEQVARLGHVLGAITERGATPMLVVDAAERFSSEMLAELGRIESAAAATNHVLKLVLSGDPTLTARLAAPDLQPLAARIALRVELRALTHTELRDLLNARAETIPGEGTTQFSRKAAREVHARSNGVPALAVAIGDVALAAARKSRADVVGPEHVRSSKLPAVPSPPAVAPRAVAPASPAATPTSTRRPSGTMRKPAATAKASEKPVAAKPVAAAKAPEKPVPPPPPAEPATEPERQLTQAELDSSHPRVRDWVSRFTDGTRPVRFGGHPPVQPYLLEPDELAPVPGEPEPASEPAPPPPPRARHKSEPTRAPAPAAREPEPAPVEPKPSPIAPEPVFEKPVAAIPIETPVEEQPIAFVEEAVLPVEPEPIALEPLHGDAPEPPAPAPAPLELEPIEPQAVAEVEVAPVVLPEVTGELSAAMTEQPVGGAVAEPAPAPANPAVPAPAPANPPQGSRSKRRRKQAARVRAQQAATPPPPSKPASEPALPAWSPDPVAEPLVLTAAHVQPASPMGLAPRSPRQKSVLMWIASITIMVGVAAVAIIASTRGGFEGGAKSPASTVATEPLPAPPAPVVIPAPPPPPKVKPAAEDEAPSGKFCLAVGTYLFEERARIVSKRLAKRTGSKVWVEKVRSDGSTSYRIMFGGFATESEAERTADRLLTRGLVTEALVQSLPSKRTAR